MNKYQRLHNKRIKLIKKNEILIKKIDKIFAQYNLTISIGLSYMLLSTKYRVPILEFTNLQSKNMLQDITNFINNYNIENNPKFFKTQFNNLPFEAKKEIIADLTNFKKMLGK